MHPEIAARRDQLLAEFPPAEVKINNADSHTSSSMIKRGTYSPVDAPKESVEPFVMGTFGGYFRTFGGGTFEYIAHTD